MDDLNNLKLQNVRLAKEVADHKNAKAEFQEVVAKVNRMIGGPGWIRPEEVLSALSAFIAKNSGASNVELEQQLQQSEQVVQQLRQELDISENKSRGLQSTIANLRKDAVVRDNDNRLLFEEAKKLRTTTRSDLRAVNNEASGHLEHLLEMERDDHKKQMGAFQSALADAFDELEAIKLPTDNKSRAVKHYQAGIRVGGKVVLSHLQHVLGVLNTLNNPQANGAAHEAPTLQLLESKEHG